MTSDQEIILVTHFLVLQWDPMVYCCDLGTRRTCTWRYFSCSCNKCSRCSRSSITSCNMIFGVQFQVIMVLPGQNHFISLAYLQNVIVVHQLQKLLNIDGTNYFIHYTYMYDPDPDRIYQILQQIRQHGYMENMI